jgi:hypothetical protein
MNENNYLINNNNINLIIDKKNLNPYLNFI